MKNLGGNMEIKKLQLGLAGSILLILGTLVPIISLPIVGSQNYFQNGQGDGVLVLLCGLAGLILVGTKKYQFLVALGAISAAVTTFTLVAILIKIAEVKSEMEASLEGNPFAGLATGLLNSVQVEWGWIVLYLGSAALIAAGLSHRREQKAQPQSSTEETA
jgi:hypothetical protein